MVRIIKDQEEYKKIITGDKLDLDNPEKTYQPKKKDEEQDILITFSRTPYDVLLDKLRNKIHIEKQEHTETTLFLRFLDTGETWELGYIHMTLDFWRFIDGSFVDLKPKMFKVKEDKLVPLKKLDYIHTGEFRGSELDVYVE